MTFGEKLQDLRRKAGLSQDSLAEKLDVSRQAVSKWERDEAMPETEKLLRIAQLSTPVWMPCYWIGSPKRHRISNLSTAHLTVPTIGTNSAATATR